MSNSLYFDSNANLKTLGTYPGCFFAATSILFILFHVSYVLICITTFTRMGLDLSLRHWLIWSNIVASKMQQLLVMYCSMSIIVPILYFNPFFTQSHQAIIEIIIGFGAGLAQWLLYLQYLCSHKNTTSLIEGGQRPTNRATMYTSITFNCPKCLEWIVLHLKKVQYLGS